MPAKSVECVGFAHPDRRRRRRRRRDAMVVNLIMSAALTLCTLIAVFAVSIGLNRADGQARAQAVWKSFVDYRSAADLMVLPVSLPVVRSNIKSDAALARMSY
jgi:hypothetical protein